MGRWAAYMLVMAAVGGALQADAQSFAASMARANDLMRSGQAQDAIALYRELQVDAPENGAVTLGLGCAFHRRAMSEAELGDMESAQGSFEQARSAFAQAMNAEDDSVAHDAAFNRATVLADEAQILQEQGQREPAVARYRQAVQAFEAMLPQWPDSTLALKNLLATRYRLKRLLQEPPPPQEEQEQQEDPQQPPPQVFSVFMNAGTDLPNARAQVLDDERTVQLVPDGGSGGGGGS